MRCNMDRNKLMQQISQCEFVCVDINLYLDTHPYDERALKDYNCYCEQLRMLKDLYIENFGPLENFGNSKSLSNCEWLWTSQPFPWQRNWMEE
jgi:spore coat protein JB